LNSGERGFVLIAAAVAGVSVIAAVGLAVDLGLVYIAKSEGQAFADSAAITAALQLDGSTTGITDAVNAVSANGNRSNFGHTVFSGTVTDFAQTASGPWLTNPSPAIGYRFARVTAQTTVSLYFLPVVVGRTSTVVKARAVAGQIPKSSFREGLFPFSVFAHNATQPPDFGLITGQLYTLRWPSNPALGNNNNGNVCPGDAQQAMIDMADATGGSDRGYIEDTSASLIAKTIVDDYQSVMRSVGDLVTLTGGAKQSQLDSLFQRIGQDSDTVSTTYANYHGNGRRIVAVPINDGGTPMGSNFRIVGIGAFLLSPTGQYGNGGNQAWCAEYIGCWLQGSSKKCATNLSSGGSGGAYVVRLVQ